VITSNPGGGAVGATVGERVVGASVGERVIGLAGTQFAAGKFELIAPRTPIFGPASSERAVNNNNN